MKIGIEFDGEDAAEEHREQLEAFVNDETAVNRVNTGLTVWGVAGFEQGPDEVRVRSRDGRTLYYDRSPRGDGVLFPLVTFAKEVSE